MSAIDLVLTFQIQRAHYSQAVIIIGANEDTSANKGELLSNIVSHRSTVFNHYFNKFIANDTLNQQGLGPFVPSISSTTTFTPEQLVTLSCNFYIIDVGDGSMTKSLSSLTNLSESTVVFEEPDAGLLAFAKYITPKLIDINPTVAYRGFEGSKNQIPPEEIPQLVYDGTQYVITDLKGTKIYYTSDTGFTGPWKKAFAAGEAGIVDSLQSLTLDKGVYFDEAQLKTDAGKQFSKYKIEQKLGSADQTVSQLIPKAVKVIPKNFKLLGPYDRNINGAREGTGSRDARGDATDAPGNSRDFTSWQSFDPVQREPSIFYHEISDEDVDMLDIEMRIDQLSDTQSFNSKGDNKAGRVKMGRMLATTIKFMISVDVIFTDGTIETDLLNVKIPLTDKKGFSVGTTRTLGTVNKTQGLFNTINQGKGKGKRFRQYQEKNTPGIVTLKGIVTSPYSFSMKDIELPEHTSTVARRVLRIEQLTYETNSSLISRKASVASVSEKSKFNFNYPFSSSIVTSIDARAFDDMPNRSYKLKGKKILIPSNYHPVDFAGADRRFSADGSTAGNVIYDGVWDGSFKFEWSDNPAWILYDLLNSFRYGTALYNRDLETIDIWSLYEIGRYCDAVDEYGKFVGLQDGFGGLEPRFSYNHKIDGDNDAFKVIGDIAKMMRCLVYYKDSQIQFRIDKPEEPSMLFNNINVEEGLFNYSDMAKASRTTSVDVNFLDAKNNYRPRTEYAEDKDAIERFGYIKQYVEGFGTTSRAQAQRNARNIIFDSIHATETVSFNAGFEASLLSPGDIIRIDDEMKNMVPNWGLFLTQTGANTPHQYPNGVFGPTGVIVDKQIAAYTGMVLTGSGHQSYISLYNATSSTKISDLYAKRDNARVTYTDEEISGLKNPKISKLQISTGAFPIEDLGDSGILIKLETGQFFPGDAGNIPSMTPFSIDVSGRLEKLYRVLNVKENDNSMYSVGAVIYHTGKYDFIENNISFDKNLDNFEVSLQSSISTLPKRPDSITVVSSGANSIGAIDFEFDILNSNPVQADQYRVILTYPNNRSVLLPTLERTGLGVNEANDIDNGKTRLSLTGDVINAFGTFELEVFSEFSKHYNKRSPQSRTLQFTVLASDLGIGDFGKVITFSDIKSSDSDQVFSESFSPIDTGSSTIGESDSQGNRLLKGEFNSLDLDIELQDYAGRNAFTESYQLKNVYNFYDINPASGNFNEQEILNSGRIGKTEFSQSFNESLQRFTIPVSGLKSGFDYLPDNSTCLSEQFSIHSSGFKARAGSGYHVRFPGEFRETPAIFVQQVAKSGVSWNDYSDLDTYELVPYVIESGNRTGFVGRSFSTGMQLYNYFAFETGNFRINNQRFKVGLFDKSGEADATITFNDNFTGTVNQNFALKVGPTVFVQRQNGLFPEICQLLNTDRTVSGFKFRSTSIYNRKETGRYAFLAIENRNQNSNEFNFIVDDDNEAQFTGGNIFVDEGLLTPYGSGIENINFSHFTSGTFNFTSNKFSQRENEKLPISGEKFAYQQVKHLAQSDTMFFEDGPTLSTKPMHATIIDGGGTGSGSWIRYNPISGYTFSGVRSTPSPGTPKTNSKLYADTDAYFFNYAERSFTLFGWFKFNSGSNQFATLIDNWYFDGNATGGFVWGQRGGDNMLFVGTGNNPNNVVTLAQGLNDGRLHSIFVSAANNGNITYWVDGNKSGTAVVEDFSSPVNLAISNEGRLSFLGPQGNGGNAGCPLTGESLTSGYAANYIGFLDGVITDSTAAELAKDPFKTIKNYTGAGLNGAYAYIHLTGGMGLITGKQFDNVTGAQMFLESNKPTGFNNTLSPFWRISGDLTAEPVKSIPINDGLDPNVGVDYTTGLHDYNIFSLGGASGNDGMLGFSYTGNQIINMDPFRDGFGFDVFVGDTDNFIDFESGHHREEILVPEGFISGKPVFSGINAAFEFGEILDNEAIITVNYNHNNATFFSYPTGVVITGFDQYTGVDSDGNFIDGPSGWLLTNSGGSADDPRNYGNVALFRYEEMERAGTQGFFSGYRNIVSTKFFTGSESGFLYNPYTDFNLAFEREVNFSNESNSHQYTGYTREFTITEGDISGVTGNLFYVAVPYTSFGPILNVETGSLTSHKNTDNKFGSFKLSEPYFSGRMFTGFIPFDKDHPNITPGTEASPTAVGVTDPDSEFKITGACVVEIARNSGLMDLQLNNQTIVLSHSAGIVEFIIDTGNMLDEWGFTIDDRTNNGVRVRGRGPDGSFIKNTLDGAAAASRDINNEGIKTIVYDKPNKAILFRAYQ